MRALIVGGGIGGLAAAVALQSAGHEVIVLEQAQQFGEVGSGLSVWPNALRALESLGVGERVRRRSQPARQVAIRDTSGTILSRTDVAMLQARFGPLVMIHRADLLDVLRSELPQHVLRPGVRVTSVGADGTVTSAGGVVRADLVVGADGINSVVRSSLWPQAPRPRYAGYSAYRMLTHPVDLHQEGESWGRGQRFGYARLPDGRVYCFAVVTGPAGQPGDSIQRLRARFERWHAPIPELLESVSAEAVLHHDLYELPRLSTYATGRVALLGDAAHAMTPNLGQGAGQAIEDATTLAATLNTHGHLPAPALADYDRQRRRRTQAIAARSRRVGAIAQWRSAPAVALRDRLLKVSPDNALLGSMTPVLAWQPPAPTSLPQGHSGYASPPGAATPSQDTSGERRPR